MLKKQSQDIVNKFKWKTARHNGEKFISPSDMTTNHLFYSWLMIWNHASPEEMRIWNKRQYIFSAYYTPEYMLMAFKAFYLELKIRQDIGPKMQEVIARIEKLYRDTIYKQAALID